jgi:hypothetical protein
LVKSSVKGKRQEVWLGNDAWREIRSTGGRRQGGRRRRRKGNEGTKS